MQSTTYIIISSIPFFVCGFWTISFLGQYRDAHISKKIIFWFMLTATLLYFAHFVVFNHIYELIPVTDTIYIFSTLSVYPIFYLYLVSLTGKVKKRDVWVLIPGITIATIAGISYWIIPETILPDFIQVCHYNGESEIPGSYLFTAKAVDYLMKIIISVQVILVLISGFRRLKKFRIRVKQSFSNTDNKDLGEIKILLIVFIVTSCLSATANLIGREAFIDSILMVSLPTVSFGIVLFIIGYIVDHQHFTIDDVLREEATKSMPDSECADNSGEETALCDNNERYRLRHEIDKLMEEEKVFLKPELKVSDLANMLNTNRTYIYEALKINEIGRAHV